MRRSTSLLIACAFALIVAAGPARAEECRAAVTESEAVAAEDARYAAMMSADVAALEKLLGDDLVYTHSSAALDSNATFIGNVQSGLPQRVG